MKYLILTLLLSIGAYSQPVEPIDSIPQGPPIPSPQPVELNIPNVITSNGDGINDLFTINNLDRYDYNNITIYSRWGTIVYKTENYQNNWDGGNVAAGVYFYVLEVLEDNKTIIHQGTLTII